jgi:hypothetical protein
MSVLLSVLLGRRTLLVFGVVLLVLLIVPAVFGRRVMGSNDIGIPFTYRSWSSARPARASFDRAALAKNIALYYAGAVCLSAIWSWLRKP